MLTAAPPIAVPPLAGTLPPACQQDLEVLCQFVNSKGDLGALAPAVPPSGFREVFLTGATGFVGRFLLRDLLVQDDTRVVHCLVRATDAEHGFERVRTALRQADIWDDGFAPRIKVVAGGLDQERLGLAESEFARLGRDIDAVYHVAAELALTAPYVNVRIANAMSLQWVLDLCLSVRFKPLFFTSTLGLFPEYFCEFAKEFADSRIETHMHPDVNVMKRVFPLGLSGYPWSKLVAEQALLTAQRAGLPLAIFRLTQTGMSTTGFANKEDMKTRLFTAMVDVGARPRGTTFDWNDETADGHSKLITDISLNPCRRYTIYNCCNPRLLYHDVVPEMFGIYQREVPYAVFKRRCLAKGARSPLHRSWPLLDYFAPYWFSGREPKDTQPICDRAIREDSPGPVKWPRPLTVLTRTCDWTRSHPDEWPYPQVVGRLDLDGLMAEGARYAEDQGLARDEVVPEWMQAGLGHLVEALHAPEAQLQEAAKLHLAFEFSSALLHKAELAGERARYPAIAATEIAQPVFIVGVNRTGTTLLHRLLSKDPRFRVVLGFEVLGSMSVDLARDGNWGTPDDVRLQYFLDELEAWGVTERLGDAHEFTPSGAEEDDWGMFQACFHSWTAAIRFHVPAYAQWLAQTDMRPAYRFHRHVLQHLTHVDHVRQIPPAQWLLKMPFHLMELEALIQTYPDALFIQTHRAPHQFTGSWNSLVERLRSLTAAPLPLREQGLEQLALVSGMMDRAVDFRLVHPELEDRWLDLSYYDLVQGPMAVVKAVYDHLGWSLGSEAAAAMDDWLIRQARRRSREPRHQYDLSDYGLTRGQVDEAFARYRDFIADRGIRLSPL